jgi:hypothetical protein
MQKTRAAARIHDPRALVLRTAARVTFHAFIIVCILTIPLAGAVSCRSGVGSWEEAIRFAQTELDAAGDLAARLDGYEQTAAELSDKIDLLDQARPALDLVGLVTADGAKIIGTLEDVLRELAELKHSLDYLNGLSAVAEETRAFRGEPTRRTLLALSSTSASATPSMRRLHAEMGEILNPINDVTNGIGGLIGGLRGASDANVPVVSDAAGEAAERLVLIEAPLQSVRDDLKVLYEGMEADAETLERIQEVVRQAKKLNE